MTERINNMTEMDPRPALTMHFRGNFFPPLPLEYVEWAAELLPKMEQADYEAHFGNLGPYDEMIPVPEAIKATRIIPKVATERDGVLVVRLGDMVEALKVHGMIAYDPEGVRDDGDDD